MIHNLCSRGLVGLAVLGPLFFSVPPFFYFIYFKKNFHGPWLASVFLDRNTESDWLVALPGSALQKVRFDCVCFFVTGVWVPFLLALFLWVCTVGVEGVLCSLVLCFELFFFSPIVPPNAQVTVLYFIIFFISIGWPWRSLP